MTARDVDLDDLLTYSARSKWIPISPQSPHDYCYPVGILIDDPGGISDKLVIADQQRACLPI